MKCPDCGNKAISFFNWAKGMRWYSTKCDSCGHVLRASAGTWIGFFAAVGLGVSGMVGYEFLTTETILSVALAPIALAIGIGIIATIGILTFFTFGGYIGSNKPEA